LKRWFLNSLNSGNGDKIKKMSIIRLGLDALKKYSLQDRITLTWKTILIKKKIKADTSKRTGK
jgi:hypothetical protein